MVPVEEPVGRPFTTSSTKSGNLEATGQKRPYPSANGRAAGGTRAFLVLYIKLGTEQEIHKYCFIEYN